jgi:hypothetical protein
MAKTEDKSAADRLRMMTQGLVQRPAETPMQRVMPVEAKPKPQKKQKTVYITNDLWREMKRAISPDGKFDEIYTNESELVEAAVRHFLGMEQLG